MTDRRRAPDPARRRFVAGGCRILAASVCLPLGALLPGCRESETVAARAPLRVYVAQLPLDQRVRFEQDGRAYELMRTADGVTARSLLCTHQGCNVRWLDDRKIYLCPCHDGAFDAEGRPIYGPPRRPLVELAVTVSETEVIVDG
jgi:Rieske Fe-S protein